jgi:hypothetical protein
MSNTNHTSTANITAETITDLDQTKETTLLPSDAIHAKYKSVLHNTSLSKRENYTTTSEQSFDALDAFLEDEKQHNKTKTWNKLDKTMRIQKLHAYAEKFIHEHGLPIKEIKTLKSFFSKCLDEQKLQKTKEVVYNKDTREITSVPGLAFLPDIHEFYIRITDAKHVSTIKSLTPKRNV